MKLLIYSRIESEIREAEICVDNAIGSQKLKEAILALARAVRMLNDDAEIEVEGQ